MNNLKIIIFWGALWGILEATLGWLLHLIHFKGEVLVLYPFGLMCMMMAVKQTGQMSSVVKVAGVAAMVKLVNLFMLPAVPVYHVTNPAVAIFLEGLVTWGFCIYAKKKEALWKIGIPVAFIMVLASIFIFRGWQLFMDAFITYNPSVHKPYDAGLFFQWGWRSLIQGIMLVGAAYLVRCVPLSFDYTKWTGRLAIPFLFVSIVLNVLL